MQDQTLPRLLVQKILRNTFSSVGRFALLALLAFLVTPYVLHQLGPVQFGVWALTGVFSTIIRLADFGIARALVKFVAEWNAREQPARINELVNTALLLLIALSLILCLSCLGLQGWLIERVFRLPEDLWPEARFVFTVIIVVSTLELILSVFQALVDGLQRMDVNNGLAMLNQSLSALGTVIMLWAGYGLRGLAVKSVLIVVLIWILYIPIVRRLQPNLVIRPRYFRLERARALFSFGMNFQVVNLVVLVIEPLNKMLLSRFLSLEFVTYYEIANRLLSPLISLFQALAQALYPAASELGVTHRREMLAALHRRALRYIALVAWPIYSLVILLAKPLIASWIGPGYAASATALQLLAAAWLISALATPAALIVQGIGMPHLAMLASVMTGAVSVVGSLALVTVTGFYGLIGANALGVAGGAILMLWLFHRVVAIPQSEVLRPIFTRALLWVSILALGTVVLLRFYRSLNLWMLTLIGLGYLALYSVGTWQLGLFDTADRHLLMIFIKTDLKGVIQRLLPEGMLKTIKKLYYPVILRSISENDEMDLKIVKHLINPGDYVVDIGANIGVYTKFLSTFVGDHGCVCSIEPIPLTFEILCSNVKKLGLTNVELINCAISDKEGYAVMEIPPYKSGGQNFYRARIVDGEHDNDLWPQVRVDLKSLDSLFPESTSKISFVKCDVEGYELQCIKGAAKVIEHSKPALLVEISENPDDEGSTAYMLFNLLKKEGYEAYWFNGKKLRRRSAGDKSVSYFFLTSEHYKHFGERSLLE